MTYGDQKKFIHPPNVHTTYFCSHNQDIFFNFWADKICYFLFYLKLLSLDAYVSAIFLSKNLISILKSGTKQLLLTDMPVFGPYDHIGSGILLSEILISILKSTTLKNFRYKFSKQLYYYRSRGLSRHIIHIYIIIQYSQPFGLYLMRMHWAFKIS